MTIYTKKRRWKFLLVIFAICIGLMSILYTEKLMKELSAEERKKIELWSSALETIINSDDIGSGQTMSFISGVMISNETIPVIMSDKSDNIIDYRNLDSVKMLNFEYRKRKLEEFKNNGKDFFVIKDHEDSELNRIYYSDSNLLIKLNYYPYIQLAIVFLFILASYFAFNISRKAEQDQVWLGMSKETAHQLGTPISSLMAWVEILKEKEHDSIMLKEIEKDTERLEKITARFSKIGSQPKLENNNLYSVILSSLNYIKTRIPKTIKISTNFKESDELFLPINSDLFEWVIENICKNAVDAIGVSGEIKISVNNAAKNIYIDISDTGKGIPKSKFQTVFSPGYTTKSRGWGLGLSLVKRIVKSYHKGKIFVKNSEIGKGSTFRIVLRTES